MECSREPTARILTLGDDVGMSNTTTLIADIYKINKDDDKKEKEFNGFEREPIILIIKTYGGYAYDALGLCGAIESSKTPVHGICMAHAMSAGISIFLSCHKRIAYRYATFMYHEISGFSWDKIEGIKQDLKEAERLQAIYDEYITTRTSILQETLNAVKEKKQDWYISCESALKLGIVHEVI